MTTKIATAPHSSSEMPPRRRAAFEFVLDNLVWFVLAIVGVAGLVSLFFLIRYHRFWREHPLLVTGLGFLTTFILVRAVSFHHVDIFLRSRVGGLKFNWILELGGIGLVGLAALLGYQNPAARTKRLAPGFIRH